MEPVSSAFLHSELTTVLPKVTLQTSSPHPCPKFLLADSITLDGVVDLSQNLLLKMLFCYIIVKTAVYSSCHDAGQLKPTACKISPDSGSCY